MTFRLSKKEARRLGILPIKTSNKLQALEDDIRGQRMNRLEQDYAEFLDYQKLEGAIHDWRFEWFRFILYHGLAGEQREASYKMDFLVILKPEVPKLIAEREVSHSFFSKSYEFEIHEVKGHWRSRDRIRFKMAAELNPWFSFKGVQRNKGQWEYEAF